MKKWLVFVAGVALALLVALQPAVFSAAPLPPPAALSLPAVFHTLAYDPQTAFDKESSDKARAVLEGAIEALGGPAYLNARDMKTEGRAFQFDRFQELNGMAPLIVYEKFPDRQRQEIGKDRRLVYVLNGDKVWEKDDYGVLTLPDEPRERMVTNHRTTVDSILRTRMKEPGATLRYAGSDDVAAKQVDIVDFEDSQNRVVTLVVERASRLPVMRKWERRNPKSGMREQNVETLGNYQLAGPVRVAHYRMRETDGQKTFEMFVAKAAVNLNLPDKLFERPPGKERLMPGRRKPS